MTLYALLDNKGNIADYPYDLRTLRRSVSLPRNPSPELLAEHGVAIIEPTDQPVADHTWNVVEGSPQSVGGLWFQSWNVEPATDAEIAERTAARAAAVKALRNRLLQESDWTQLPDAPVHHEAWAMYREQLRQVKEQPGFPWEVTWPVSPADATARPRAEAVGQEWTDRDGQLWRVVQVRLDNGTFAQDDPATPERESLQWEMAA